MERLLPPALALGLLLALAMAPAAVGRSLPADDGRADAPPKAVVKIRPGNLDGGRARILSTVPVAGVLRPFAPRQRVRVTFFRNGKPIKRTTVRVRKAAEGRAGVFSARIRIRRPGAYAVSARHAPTPLLGGDRTIRKRWRVSFPALPRRACGRVVAGFKLALRRMGYIVGEGRCLDDKTRRGILAYRKVNGMEQSFHASSRLVRRVFAGRGRYRVRHPDAGRHVEVPLSKQVLVFAKGGRPLAVYPVSTGKPSTPTVTGRYEFFRTEPGYNQKDMYYSWYFYRGYAVHGFASVPEYPASHGCIRTYIADQPEVYERIRMGESIFVF